MAGADPSTIIVALSGATAVVIGNLLSRAGQRDAARQTAAAAELQERAQKHDEYRDMLADYRTELDRVRAARERDARECSRTIDQLRDVVRVLRGVVTSEVARASADDAASEAESHVLLHDLDDREAP